MSTNLSAIGIAFHDALAVQSACNLSGVLETLHRHLPAIRADCDIKGGGIDTFNRHPVCRLFAEQIAHLTGMQVAGDLDSYSAACQEAKRRFGLTFESIEVAVPNGKPSTLLAVC